MNSSTQEQLTIVIADDHGVVRAGLQMLLELESDLRVVGEGCDLPQTQTLVRELTPCVVLLGLHMGRERSLVALSELLAASPRTAIVILTMDDDPAFARQAWSAGAAGHVLKEASPTDLVRAIRAVGAGGRYLDPAVGGWALGTDTGVLSERELEVLRLIALGYTNSEIARLMFTSSRTVESHGANLQRSGS